MIGTKPIETGCLAIDIGPVHFGILVEVGSFAGSGHVSRHNILYDDYWCVSPLKDVFDCLSYHIHSDNIKNNYPNVNVYL